MQTYQILSAFRLALLCMVTVLQNHVFRYVPMAQLRVIVVIYAETTALSDSSCLIKFATVVALLDYLLIIWLELAYQTVLIILLLLLIPSTIHVYLHVNLGSMPFFQIELALLLVHRTITDNSLFNCVFRFVSKIILAITILKIVYLRVMHQYTLTLIQLLNLV